MVDVVIAGAGPDGLMLACELGLAGIRPVVLDPTPGPNLQPRANRIAGQAARILDHRGLYSELAERSGAAKTLVALDVRGHSLGPRGDT